GGAGNPDARVVSAGGGGGGRGGAGRVFPPPCAPGGGGGPTGGGLRRAPAPRGPQGMAYAELAGLPAITGLYTSILCLIGYALFGPSKILVLGPDSSLGPMIAAPITPL